MGGRLVLGMIKDKEDTPGPTFVLSQQDNTSFYKDFTHKLDSDVYQVRLFIINCEIIIY